MLIAVWFLVLFEFIMLNHRLLNAQYNVYN